MSEELKIGQSLTYEQVCNLPDGAEIKAHFAIYDYVLWKRDGMWLGFERASPDDVATRSIDTDTMWRAFGWHSAVLVSLPAQEPSYPFQRAVFGPPIADILGSAAGPLAEQEPSPGEGYRWVLGGEILLHTDESKMQDGKIWRRTTLDGEPCGPDCTYRRRIEPQTYTDCDSMNIGGQATFEKTGERRIEPQADSLQETQNAILAAPPAPRVASEIEKDAAQCLLSERLAAFISEITKCAHISHESIFSVHAKIEGAYCRYTYAKDYARSIGAIE